MFYSQNDYRYYLMHHGVKGQKWGVQNGPPYPLGSDSPKPSAKKTTRQDVQKYKRDLIKRTRESDAKDTRNRKSGVKDASSIKGASKFIAGFALIGLGIYSPRLIKGGAREFIAGFKKDLVFQDIKRSKNVDPHGIPLKRKELTPKQDLAKVNPSYDSVGSRMNCMGCTSTYDLRRRGYNVTAGLLNEGFGITRIEKWYPGAKLINWDMPGFDPYHKSQTRKELMAEREASVNKLIDGLVRQGDGARGHFAFQWKSAGGHDMIYEIENGKLILMDGQSNKIYSDTVAIRKALTRSWNIETYRIDNVEPDLAKMIEDGVIRWDPKQK